MSWAFINDDFIPEEKALIHFKDLAIQRGYGIFDFFKVLNDQPCFLQQHLQRFFYSAQQMHLTASKTAQELENIINELISKNGLGNSGIRITLTGGYSPDGYSLTQPNLIISQSTFSPPTQDQVREGISLITYPHQRQLPSVKTIDYLMAVWLQPTLKTAGATDVLYEWNDHVTECPRSNFFIVTKNKTIVTPALNILNGITRERVLNLAAQKFEIAERNITINEVLDAAEAFITSTTKSILPVAYVNGSKIGDGKFTFSLELLEQLHQQPAISN